VQKRVGVVAGSPRACGWVKRGQECQKSAIFLFFCWHKNALFGEKEIQGVEW
jgi:hypothetical protein